MLSAERSRPLDERGRRGAGGDDAVAAVEIRVVMRGSRRARARRGSPRAPAPRRPRAAPAGAGRRAAGAGPSALRSRPASRHIASRVARDGGGARSASGGAPSAACGPAPARRARPAPRGGRTRSTPRASSRRAGWRRAGRCRRTRRPRTGRRPCCGRAGPRRSRPSRSGSPGRPARAAVAGSWPDSRSAATTLGKRAGSIAVMSRYTAGAPVSTSRRWIARATASRGCSSSTNRSPAASCSVAPSPRTASETRKPSRPGIPTTAVGWNWANSRSARSAPGGAREQQARAVGAGRVRGARPQRRGAARGEDHRARRDDAPVVAGDRADAPVVAREQRAHAAALEHLDALLLDDVGGELAQDPPPGRAAAGVDDAPDPVAALEPEREVAVAVGVEAHAERLEVGEARGRLRRTAPPRPSAARARGRRSPCPARCSAGESSTASAAARPPWAQ